MHCIDRLEKHLSHYLFDLPTAVWKRVTTLLSVIVAVNVLQLLLAIIDAAFSGMHAENITFCAACYLPSVFLMVVRSKRTFECLMRTNCSFYTCAQQHLHAGSHNKSAFMLHHKRPLHMHYFYCAALLFRCYVPSF